MTKRHSSRCKVCQSPDRAEIERKVREFYPHALIGKQHGMSAYSVRRHCIAIGLDRNKDVTHFLASVIEKCQANVAEVTMGNALRAAEQLSKISGQTVDRLEITKVVESMKDKTDEELRAIVERGRPTELDEPTTIEGPDTLQ